MMFCEKCGTLIVPNEKKQLKCSSCGYKSKQKSLVIKEKVNNKKPAIEIVDKTIETLPKTEVECPKCGNNQAFYWTAQTRASDEGETIFYKCIKCSNQWRDYS